MPRYADIQRRYTVEDVEDVHQTWKRCFTIILHIKPFLNVGRNDIRDSSSYKW